MTNENVTNEMPIENTVQNSNSSKQPGSKQNKKFLIISIVAAIVIIALIVLASYFLLTADPGVTEQIRDVFIIFMAFVSLIIGAAMVILIIQVSILINLLQNEIRPIINSTNETVNTLKGTTKFLSNNLTEPVIKVNQALAVLKQVFTFKRR